MNKKIKLLACVFNNHFYFNITGNFYYIEHLLQASKKTFRAIIR